MWRVIITFAVTVLIIYLSYLFSRYVGRSMSGGGSSRYMRVVDQLTVGQDRQLAIVQVGDKYLLIGITAGEINILTEVEDKELLLLSPDDQQTNGKTPNFKEMMEKFGDFTKKGR